MFNILIQVPPVQSAIMPVWKILQLAEIGNLLFASGLCHFHHSLRGAGATLRARRPIVSEVDWLGRFQPTVKFLLIADPNTPKTTHVIRFDLQTPCNGPSHVLIPT